MKAPLKPSCFSGFNSKTFKKSLNTKGQTKNPFSYFSPFNKRELLKQNKGLLIVLSPQRGSLAVVQIGPLFPLAVGGALNAAKFLAEPAMGAVGSAAVDYVLRNGGQKKSGILGGVFQSSVDQASPFRSVSRELLSTFSESKLLLTVLNGIAVQYQFTLFLWFFENTVMTARFLMQWSERARQTAAILEVLAPLCVKGPGMLVTFSLVVSQFSKPGLFFFVIGNSLMLAAYVIPAISLPVNILMVCGFCLFTVVFILRDRASGLKTSVQIAYCLTMVNYLLFSTLNSPETLVTVKNALRSYVFANLTTLAPLFSIQQKPIDILNIGASLKSLSFPQGTR